MVTTSTKVHTADDLLTMEVDAPYELIRGELRKATPTGMKPSVIGGRLFGFLFPYVELYTLGYLTNADGGYVLSRNRDTIVAPDIGFIRKERLPGGLPDEGYCPVPPDLAIEVTSPTDEAGDIADKLAAYERAGVPLVWWIEPRYRRTRVYRLGKPVEVLTYGDVLDGDDILPGFRLPGADIFAQ